MRNSIVDKNNKNGLLKSIFKTSATNISVMILSMLTSVITARMFGVEGRGEFSAITFWPVFVTSLISLGLPTSLVYHIKKNQEDGFALNYLKIAYKFQTPVATIAIIIVWFILPHILKEYSVETIQIVRWYTLLMLPVIISINLLSALAQSINQFSIYNGLRMLVPLFNVIALVILWILGLLSIKSAALIYLITTLVIMIWAIYKLYPFYKIRFKKHKERFASREFINYGLKVFGVELLGTQIDRLIVMSQLSVRDFGLYSVMYALSRVFNSVQTAIVSVVFPKVTGMSNSEIIIKVTSIYRISMTLMIISIIPAMLIGHYLIELLFGKEFSEASSTFYILSLECVVGGGAWILASAFNALGRPGVNLARQLVGISVTVGFAALLIPHNGLNGMAVALLIGAISRLLYTMFSFYKMFQVSFIQFLFSRNDIIEVFKATKSKILSKMYK